MKWLSALGTALSAFSRLVVGFFLRKGGKDSVKADANADAAERARRRNQIDAEVARLDDDALSRVVYDADDE